MKKTSSFYSKNSGSKVNLVKLRITEKIDIRSKSNLIEKSLFGLNVDSNNQNANSSNIKSKYKIYK